MSPRVDKPLIVKVADLDDNLYLLDDQVARLNVDWAHYKLLTVLLRSLVCYSSETEGLLWRVVEELNPGDPLATQAKQVREGLKTSGSVTIRGKHLTVDYLIRAASQQLGAAHESDDVDEHLVMATQYAAGGFPTHTVDVLAVIPTVFRLGNAALDYAVENIGYHYKPRRTSSPPPSTPPSAPPAAST